MKHEKGKVGENKTFLREGRGEDLGILNYSSHKMFFILPPTSCKRNILDQTYEFVKVIEKQKQPFVVTVSSDSSWLNVCNMIYTCTTAIVVRKTFKIEVNVVIVTGRN